MQRFALTPIPTAVVVLWWRGETHWVHCTARMTQVFQIALTTVGLGVKRRAECAESIFLNISCISQCD